jgi:hypothetical protein
MPALLLSCSLLSCGIFVERGGAELMRGQNGGAVDPLQEKANAAVDVDFFRSHDSRGKGAAIGFWRSLSEPIG